LIRKAYPAVQKGPNEVIDEIPEQQEEDVFLANELLVEEVSIDGMCGVY
jgi:mycofactocin precursor